MTILDLPPILQTRRNHALEHATLHILAQKFPGRPLAGHSNPTGFFILGSVPAEDIRAAAVQALTRLRAGERQLAIHAGCGTNYVVSGLLAGSLAWVGLSGARTWRARLLRLPFVLVLSTFAFLISQPLGPILQARVTTEAEPGGMDVVEITPLRLLGLSIHRVVTKG